MNLPIIVDLETAPHPCAAEFIERIDPESVKAPKNYTKPDSIAAYIAQRRSELEAEYTEKLARCSLDWNLARIVAIGWTVDGGESTHALAFRDEEQEADALRGFWYAAKNCDIAGFCARTFDVPMLIQRSRLLQVPHPRVNLARFGRGSVIDLRDILTFEDARYEAIMPRSLHCFCRRFGIPVDDPIDGSQIGQLVAEGKWEDVIAHVRSDVQLTAALARRIGVLQTQEASIF